MSSTQPESEQFPTDLDAQPGIQPILAADQTDGKFLAQAIDRIVKSNLPNKVKLREPDPFDGSDTQKLRTFILQCKLNFRDRSDLFQNDSTKVNYMLSHLKGSALDCFEPTLLETPEPAWLSDFALFIEELEANFGTYDPISEAEAKLEGLHMQENHQATKYFIKFMQLATCVQWGKAALLRQAYNGLVKCIKNDMVHHDKLTTLSGLRRLTQAIDARYWEHHAEVSQETTTSGTTTNKSEKSDTAKMDSKYKGKQKSASSGSSQSKGSSLELKKTTPDLSSKLRKDGKLAPQEQQCRLDKNLCLFCSAPGHVAKDCPKCTSSAAKAHAAKTTPESISTPKPSSSDAKKD